MKILVLTIITVLLISVSAKASYVDTVIQGWNIKLSSDLISEHREYATGVIALLDAQLRTVATLLPVVKLEPLRKAPIWIELKSVRVGPIQFHNSVEWLKANGQDPAKEKCIEISAPEYINAGSITGLLQYISYAYYFRVVGAENTDMLAAYGSMVSKRLYQSDSVMRSEPAAYFAILSAEYFMARSSDIHPQMRKYDANGIAMIEKYWLHK